MENVAKSLKSNLMGFLALLLFCFVVISTDLLSLLIILLFIYLFTDIVITITRRWLPIPKTLLLLLLYALLTGIFTYFVLNLAPNFLRDTSSYIQHLKGTTKALILSISDRYNLHLDLLFIREKLFEEFSKSFGHLVKIFNHITKGIVYFVFALILNFLLHTEYAKIKAVFTANEGSLLSYIYLFITTRICRFYMYFKKVMLGQILISLINTGITTILIYILDLPYKPTLIFFVFLFGLIPVVGNLVSNTILATTTLVSCGTIPASFCLLYLVVIHKTEYFLNSKIIGSMIRIPMFITLIALITGEILLGVLGMIIAIPLFLTLKQEFEDIPFLEEHS